MDMDDLKYLADRYKQSQDVGILLSICDRYGLIGLLEVDDMKNACSYAMKKPEEMDELYEKGYGHRGEELKDYIINIGINNSKVDDIITFTTRHMLESDIEFMHRFLDRLYYLSISGDTFDAEIYYEVVGEIVNRDSTIVYEITTEKNWRSVLLSLSYSSNANLDIIVKLMYSLEHIIFDVEEDDYIIRITLSETNKEIIEDCIERAVDDAINGATIKEMFNFIDHIETGRKSPDVYKRVLNIEDEKIVQEIIVPNSNIFILIGNIFENKLKECISYEVVEDIEDAITILCSSVSVIDKLAAINYIEGIGYDYNNDIFQYLDIEDERKIINFLNSSNKEV